MTLAVSAAPMRDATDATPLSTTDIVSQEFVDESYKAFDSYGKEEEAAGDSTETTASNTVWNLLSTIYIPLLLLRLRHTIFGVAGFLYSILFGQCLQFLVSLLSPSPETWNEITHSPWLAQLLGSRAKDPNAWPPLTLKLLAVLTILAFIVHPDGMTWIMLGKLRNAMYTLLESSSTCWNFIIADYGILSTIAALATFFSLFGLMYVLHKTLTPKTPKRATTKSSDRKKKKRKGNHPRGGRGRIKNKGGKQQQNSPTEVQPPTRNDATNSVNEKAPLDSSLHKTEFLPKELTTAGSSELQPSRSRGESSSTVDTTAMDDQSIESAPSAASTVVSRSPRSLNRLEEGKKKTSQQNLDKKRANVNKNKGRKGPASKGNGVVAASPSRPDGVYRPPPLRNASSPLTTPNAGRSRSRRGGGNAYGKPFRSLADRMASSPVPPSNVSLFSTPLSSPTTNTTTHTTVAAGRSNPSNVPGLQTPILTPPPPAPATSVLSHESSVLAPNYPATTAPTGGTSVFYNGPNYRPRNSGETELAAFLTRVGLVGTVYEDLVEALDNVDALYRLSDAQFELYNVSPDQKRRIDMMLSARGRRQESALAILPGAIRPPPGLSAPSSCIAKPSETYHQSTVLVSPPRLNHASSMNIPSPPSISSPPSGHLTMATRTDVDFGGSPTLMPQLPSLSHPSSYNASGRLYEQGDEEIEAELQELGGQMVGSVLDF